MTRTDIDLLDSYTSIKLRDLALIKIHSSSLAEALRVLVMPAPKGQTFLERRAATIRAKEALAAFDAMPNDLDIYGKRSEA